MTERSATNFTVIGETGTGKTSVVLKLLQGKSAAVYTFSPDDPLMQTLPDIASADLASAEPGKHYKVVEFEDYRATLNNFIHNYRNGNIIYDDIRPIMKSNVSRNFELLLTGVRHRGNDQWFIFQHTLHVPPFLCDSTKHLLLFKQPLSREGEINDNLPRLEEVKRAIAWVQASPDIHAYAYLCCDIRLPASQLPFSKFENLKQPA